MDDGRVKVKFYPELQRIAISSTTGDAHSSQTTIHKAAQKSVPDLLRSASAILLNASHVHIRGERSRRPDRKVVVYITDGPSGNTQELLRAVDEQVKSRRRIEVIAVGFGDQTDLMELTAISGSRNKGEHLFRLISPNAVNIETLIGELTLSLCGTRNTRPKSDPIQSRIRF